MASIGEALLMAFDHHQAGRLVEAETLYRRVIDADAEQADAWHLLGVLAAQSGRTAGAAAALARALALRPFVADYHVNLANALRGAGRLGEAGPLYARAFRLGPLAGEAVAWLAVWHARQGRVAEAEALAADLPDAAERVGAAGLHELGMALSSAGAPVAAIRLLEAAARLAPDSAVTLGNLGLLLQRAGQPERAEACHRRVLASGAAFPAVREGLAMILVERAHGWRRDGRTDEAAGLIAEACRLAPDLSLIHI